MLASLRPFLRFIDLDSTFVDHGFKRKVRERHTCVRDYIYNRFTGRCSVQAQPEEAGGLWVIYPPFKGMLMIANK